MRWRSHARSTRSRGISRRLAWRSIACSSRSRPSRTCARGVSRAPCCSGDVRTFATLPTRRAKGPADLFRPTKPCARLVDCHLTQAVKFVHAADLHLDSPIRNLPRYDGAPVEAASGATRRALGKLVTLCIEEQASMLLLSGDLVDAHGRDYKTGLFFVRDMLRLREAGIPVFSVRGNHDA